MNKRWMALVLALAMILTLPCLTAWAEAPAALTAEDFAQGYLLPVSRVEQGTAGSSLKLAQAAAEAVAFAAERSLRQADLTALSAAWDALGAEGQSGFAAVFPALDALIAGWESEAAAFEDAGVGEEMARLMANPADWLALREATLALLPAEYTLEGIRRYVVGVDEPVLLADGTRRPLINFDNAATTPALQPVMDEVNRELRLYGSIGRGFSQKSDHSTDLYNATRDRVLAFVHADPETYTCFYVNNTTDGLNKLASALIESEDDLVLATRMEHHANDLSWRERCRVIYAEVDEQGRVDYEEIERLLRENDVKYVTVTAASNVTGYVTDVHRVAALAHRYGAKIIVDGAQIVSHRAFSMLGDTPEGNIDFFVFSAHKMYSPYGGGAVVGLTEELNRHMPAFYGGGTIKIVGDAWQHYKDAPASYEAGSPNYPGVVGMGKAMEILTAVGFDAIRAHEQVLVRRLVDGLKQFDNVVIYGDTADLSDRVGVVTFNVTDVNSYLLAQELSKVGGIATRRGAFCANPYVWRLLGVADEDLEFYEDCGDMNTPGMIRVSFGIYNTVEEVDEFLRVLPLAMEAATKDLDDLGNVVLEY